MGWRRPWRSLWNTLTRSRRLDRDLDEELRAYLDEAAERHVDAGLSPASARRAALLQFEGLEQVKEQVRDVRVGAAIESVLLDVRHALRGLGRSPGFAAAAVITLTLGIGSSVAVFSVVRAVLIRPLPYANADQVVFIWDTDAGRLPTSMSAGRLLDLKTRAVGFAGIAGIGHVPMNLTEGTEPERLLAVAVSTNFFEVLGVQPLLGRTFEVGREHQQSVVITHRLWQRRFGSDPAIVGRRIRFDSGVRVVTAVMPPGFVWRVVGGAGYHGPQPEIFMPAPEHEVPPLPVGASRARPLERRDLAYLRAVARLGPGQTIDTAHANLVALARQLAAQYPATDRERGFQVVPALEQLAGAVRTPLLLLLGAVGLVLAIACTNVANLLLGRTRARQAEFAIRVSLGAGRARLARQFLVESLLLSGLAAALGTILAHWTLASLLVFSPADIARLDETRVDPAVSGVAVLLALLSAGILSLVPLTVARRLPTLLHEASARTGRRVGRGHGGWLLVGEVALAVTLVIGAGLLVRSLAALHRVDTGIAHPERALTFGLALGPELSAAPERQARFYEEVTERLSRLPHVRAVGGAVTLPMGGDDWNTAVYVEGLPLPAPGQEEMAGFQSATPGYFQALGLPLRAGRDFDARDTARAPGVVVVNEVFAARHWGTVSAVGRRLRFSAKPEQPWLTVVGVVQNVLHFGPASPPRSEVYVPSTQQPFPFMTFVVRTDTDPMNLVPSIRSAMVTLDPSLPLADMQTMDRYIGGTMAQTRFLAALLTAFGALALLLAAVGIFGVTSWSVLERRREIGIRMAVGATSAEIVRMVLRQGGTRIGLGFAAGVALALGLGRLMSSVLFGVRTLDPTTYAITLVVLVAVALAALAFPAGRAARVDAARVLRD